MARILASDPIHKNKMKEYCRRKSTLKNLCQTLSQSRGLVSATFKNFRSPLISKLVLGRRQTATRTFESNFTQGLSCDLELTWQGPYTQF